MTSTWRTDIPVLLAEAESGSLDSLTELCHALEPDKMTIDLVRAALRYLRIDRMPKLSLKPGEVLPKNRETQQAVQFCYVLYVATFECYENPSLLEATVEEALPLIDDLCMWIKFFTTHKLAVYMGQPGVVARQHEIAFRAHNHLLFHLVELDPRLFHAFLDSNAYMDLLLHLWTAMDDEGKPYMGITHSRSTCPLLTVLLKTLDDDNGKAILFDSILTRQDDFTTRFITATLSRIHRVAFIANGDKNITLEKAMQYISNLVEVLRLLLTNNTLRYQLVRSSYLRAFTSAFNQFFLKAWAKFGLVHKIWHEDILKPIISLSLFFDGNEDPRVIKNLGDMVDGGFPTVLVYALANACQDDKSDTVDMGLTMLDILACHAIYPTISTRVSLESIPKTLINKISTNSRIRDAWTSFEENVKDGVTSYTRFKSSGITLCDNPLCNRPPNTIVASKKCSNCSYFVYCSAQCQKEDWLGIHREECCEAREDYLYYKGRAGWYSHSTRAYHMTYVAALYNQLLIDGSLSEGASNSDAHSPPHQSKFVMMDFTVAKVAISTHPLDVVEESNPRRRSLIQECLSNSRSGSRRLVTAVFTAGNSWKIRLAVALTETAPYHFYPTYSIFRYE